MNLENEEITIQFLGAAGTVTGSKYLLRARNKRILIDCGLFQGLKELRLLNWQPLPVDVSTIDAVLLTHGHLDHVGFLPRLFKQGYRGPVFGTKPTLEVTTIILTDSAKIQEEDAARANAYHFSKHKPALPLYDQEDVKKTVQLFRETKADEWITLAEGISYRFNYNSHIIGATFIELRIGQKVLVFSGDIGREDDLLLRPPHHPLAADVIVMESTYGNKLHPKQQEEQLIQILKEAAENGSTVLIPGFAVERAQLLMYIIWKLLKTKRIPDVPVYLDSPMGASVLDLFQRNTSWHKLSKNDCQEMTRKIKVTEKIEDSVRIMSEKGCRIIIAGSGMATGGRVLMYFQKYIGDPSAVVLLTGYQAEGTRGRRLLDGETEIKLYGKYYPVKAQIKNIEGLSSHADQKGLLLWLSDLTNKPERIFLVHGETSSLKGLKESIKQNYHWNAEIPSLNQTINIKG